MPGGRGNLGQERQLGRQDVVIEEEQDVARRLLHALVPCLAQARDAGVVYLL